MSLGLVDGLDQSMKEILDSLLGTPLEIAKTRQIWRDGGVMIHVDDVRGRGGVVEIESRPETDGSMIDRYRRLLAPFCGSPTTESNVDFARRRVSGVS